MNTMAENQPTTSVRNRNIKNGRFFQGRDLDDASEEEKSDGLHQLEKRRLEHRNP